MCNLLTRRTALERSGGGEERFVGLYEDQALLAKLYLTATAVVSGHCTAWYRQHPESACALGSARGEYRGLDKSPAQLRYLEWLCHHVATTATADVELDRAVAQALHPYRHPHRVALAEHARSCGNSYARISGDASADSCRTTSGILLTAAPPVLRPPAERASRGVASMAGPRKRAATLTRVSGSP
jgi:hypothetical protein